jgi:hypothetical protein
VNPNEGVNGDGDLPGALQLEGKVWATKKVSRSIEGGLVYTHILGERFTPSLEILGRYVYTLDDPFAVMPADLFEDSYGQKIFIEKRGDRHFASRGMVDAHLEWRTPKRAILTLDLFNVLGANALVDIKTSIDDLGQIDPIERFGAPRRRVAPRTLRIGLRVD